MLKGTHTILEVEGLSKLYARRDATSRNRMAKNFSRAMFWRPYEPPTNIKDDEFWGLKDISFSLNRGEAVGVIGFNGAGKTTLLRILSGQLLPDSGEIRTLGKSAAMIELTAGFSANASGRRNIFLRGAMLGRSHEEMKSSVDEIIEFSELGDAIDAPFSTYSSGMKMRLAFSVMIASEPDILFIDEILSVGDFRFQQKCLAKIREIRERVAFVLVSHSMGNIRLFCDEVIVLNEGEIAFIGKPDEAIEVYEQMRFPQKLTQEEHRTQILKPQFHNPDAIPDIEHFWCDSTGRPISEIQPKAPLFFKVNFKLNFTPKNLIMGIPVWSEDGVYVTGFSTPRDGKGLDVTIEEHVSFMMEVPSLAFNPGEYVSNISIHDGLEFLYRGANPALKVAPTPEESWGFVTLPHTWEKVAQ